MMTIAQIMEKMIAFSEENIHDIAHLSCVWIYAKTIHCCDVQDPADQVRCPRMVPVAAASGRLSRYAA